MLYRDPYSAPPQPAFIPSLLGPLEIVVPPSGPAPNAAPPLAVSQGRAEMTNQAARAIEARGKEVHVFAPTTEKLSSLRNRQVPFQTIENQGRLRSRARSQKPHSQV